MHIRIHLVPESCLPPAVPATAVFEDGADGDGEADLFCNETVPDGVADVCVDTIRTLRDRRHHRPR